MSAVSIDAAGAAVTAAITASRNASTSGPSTANTSPGFVQNCPTPSVIEATNPCPIASAREASAPGRRNTGLMLLISANTGIGSGRAAAASHSARPATREPVKPTPQVAGCCTIAIPITLPCPCSIEKVPAGMSQASTALAIAVATSSDVPGWARCALTTTGFPVHRALAVSPPATEKASGKLLEPNTTTGPTGRLARLRSGRGRGCRSGRARSILGSVQFPSRAKAANSRN